MNRQQAHPGETRGVRRRDLLKAGLAAGVTLSTWPLHTSLGALGCRSGTAQARRHPARAWL